MNKTFGHKGGKKLSQSSFKILGQLLKQLESKKSVFFISLLFGIVGSLIWAAASYLIGSVTQAIFTPPGYAPTSNDPIVLGLIKIPPLGSIFILFALYVLYLVLILFQNFIMVKISQVTSSKLRWQSYCRLQEMPISYFDSHSSGDLMSRMTNDIDNISQALTQAAAQFIQTIFTVLFTFILMMVLSPYLTLISIFILFLLMSISFLFVKKAQPYFIMQQDRLGDLNGYIEEMFSGHKVVALLNRQKETCESFEVYNNALVPSAVRSQTYSSLIMPWFNFISNILFLLVAVIAALFKIYGISTGGISTIDIAFIISFITLLRNFSNPINQILSISNLIQAGLAGAERVFYLINLIPPHDKPGAKPLSNIEGHVKFDHVNFGYLPGKLNLIDANIAANPGETIAIVGPTGAGKTTIINLLTKFYNYNSGSIVIDKHEITDSIETSWRDQITIVLQDTYLFTTTIKENIRYGDLSATDEQIISAAKIADAHNFIMQLENGYDTIVESNGENFSQGQRQLLAIARAVIKKAPILVLDEATSSVDTRTEIQIQNAMLRLMQGKTSFVIAHRLSTIKNATIILVVSDGKIIERGTHDQLLALNGFYANLYNSQFKKGITEDVDLE